jgi:hypothetical protein
MKTIPRLVQVVAALLSGTAAFAPAQTPPAPLPPPTMPVAIYLTWQRDPVTTMTVHWHTEWTQGFADSVLEYRRTGAGINSPWSRASGHAAQMPYTNRMVHTVEISGLTGNTRYEFRLGRLTTRESDGGLEFAPFGPAHAFSTLPPNLNRPVKFISGGDIYGGDHVNLMTEMCRIAAARDPEFALLGGDIAYVNNEPKAADRWFNFFQVWGDTMKTTDGRLIPVIPAIGNHEVHGDTYEIRGGAPNRGVSTDRALFFYTLFSFPGRPGYKAIDVGDYLSIIALDSFHSNPVPGAQTDWLRGVLASRRAVPYVVPFYHVPAYPSYRSFAGAISVAVRANWVPLFDEAGVRFAFENHDHAYKVSHPLRGGEKHADGTRYLGDGAWAVNAREVRPLAESPYLERALSRNHVFVVTLHRDRADFVAIDPQGVEFDKFSIKSKR